MGAYDGLDTFFVYLLPHGLLEITAVLVGAGAGLRTFWAWVRPGSAATTVGAVAVRRVH